MKYSYAMPFGAELAGSGTRFRLWAPAAREVGLHLVANDSRSELAMSVAGDGWFELAVPGTAVGARYAFCIDGGIVVPDPASRSNPDDVHQPSRVVDPASYEWSSEQWTGRPWEEAVIYELHVGAFTPEGTFAAVVQRLDHLAELGVTAIELMPVADFPGKRNWGYDGVLPFAPDASYGEPDDLKRLIDAAHSRSLMVMLDVVYNHFGPEGNYLHAYAPQFFNPDRQTPWGAAINMDGEGSRTVRDFFIHNAQFWLEEYRFDGLRFDAVDRIVDASSPHFLMEITSRLRDGPGRDRHIHLVFENDRNQASYLGRDAKHQPLFATAQWNDDAHHSAHVVTTGEVDGYYADYADRPLWYLGRCLAEGFGYQSEASPYRGGEARGEPSVHLPPVAFVNFLQTHDQVGNRALGERLGQIADARALRAAIVCVLLSPSPPLLFMGEEYSASTPFLFFCDFGPELASAVTQGRRREFGRFDRFRDTLAQAAIPDPSSIDTFEKSKLAWREAGLAQHAEMLAFYRECLRVRAAAIVPRLFDAAPSGTFEVERGDVLYVHWTLGDGSRLHLTANFSRAEVHRVEQPDGNVICATDPTGVSGSEQLLLPCSAVVRLAAA